ncbi:DUF4175 domain-containing protein [Ruixingdingia sedimenti]|uniref:DUF4175 family protein n=1 Tax=Ruixingdingia sedimenti TaxID=3073604 RepID=A0ABU1F979_9RHOB|nr:DUF4175 family protein [Xinfangfangia sp. LG-4]MDR5653448.1 DUF4175 family protein [Xinfangfangia sp. LG-4]
MTADTSHIRPPARLRRALALTRAGMVAERLARAFWPAWTVAVAALAALAFGAQDALSPQAGTAVFGAAGLVVLVLAARGAWRFRWPRAAEARARLDATLPGRPLAAMADRQAIGAGDAASAAVWQAHVDRMAARAAQARAPAPDLRLARADPFALRYVALTALAMAALFGVWGRVAAVTALAPGAGPALAGGPAWEGWIQPPAYTGQPTLYLNEVAAGGLHLPQGSRVMLRFYGAPGAFDLTETVSPPAPAATDTPATSAAEFDVTRPGRIEIDGPGGRAWDIALLPDTPPDIAPEGVAHRGPRGELRQGFTARDDYGVTGGRAEIALDLAAVDRRYGLAADPEPRAPLVLDLPLPFRGDRRDFTETLSDDVSKHPFANLPVTIRLMAEDAQTQTGMADPLSATLPGRRFFDPLAAAIIEARRDLLWTAANARRTAQILRAVTNRPEGFIRNERAFLRLRVALRRLEAASDPVLAPEVRDEIAEVLWDIALLVEEGDLASALERLKRAQDRLDEAMKNGASEDEIADLMREFREALDNYMRQLAQEAERNPDSQLSQDMQGMQMTGDQLQQMLDRLQQLMEEGRMAEAAELMEMLRRLMENMQVTQGPGGQGQGQGNQAMRDLQETLRDQQGLSDEAFRDLQEDFNGQPGEGEGEGADPGDLADRQRALRDRLRGLDQGRLPGEGSDRGDAGRRALDRAGRAMEEAEESLRQGDLPGALDRQAEALEALREGMREFNQALAEDQQGQPGQPGQDFGNADPAGPRDPLGRRAGESGRIGTDENMLGGENPHRRAEDLLDELRRRSGERTRPEEELDYLRRLLDRF